MLPIQITFRKINYSPAIESNILKYFNKTYRLYNRITNCHVVIEKNQNHTPNSRLFRVCIDIKSPAKELLSIKQGRDLYATIKSAFCAIERLLEKNKSRKKTDNAKYTFVYDDIKLQPTDYLDYYS